jgi:hypothetical protein
MVEKIGKPRYLLRQLTTDYTDHTDRERKHISYMTD